MSEVNTPKATIPASETSPTSAPAQEQGQQIETTNASTSGGAPELLSSPQVDRLQRIIGATSLTDLENDPAFHLSPVERTTLSPFLSSPLDRRIAWSDFQATAKSTYDTDQERFERHTASEKERKAGLMGAELNRYGALPKISKQVDAMVEAKMATLSHLTPFSADMLATNLRDRYTKELQAKRAEYIDEKGGADNIDTIVKEEARKEQIRRLKRHGEWGEKTGLNDMPEPDSKADHNETTLSSPERPAGVSYRDWIGMSRAERKVAIANSSSSQSSGDEEESAFDRVETTPIDTGEIQRRLQAENAEAEEAVILTKDTDDNSTGDKDNKRTPAPPPPQPPLPRQLPPLTSRLPLIKTTSSSIPHPTPPQPIVIPQPTGAGASQHPQPHAPAHGAHSGHGRGHKQAFWDPNWNDNTNPPPDVIPEATLSDPNHPDYIPLPRVSRGERWRLRNTANSKSKPWDHFRNTAIALAVGAVVVKYSGLDLQTAIEYGRAIPGVLGGALISTPTYEVTGKYTRNRLIRFGATATGAALGYLGGELVLNAAIDALS